jgi:F-type H+-transporting ATPase subunit alpha
MHICGNRAKGLNRGKIAATLENYGAMDYTVIVSDRHADPAAAQFYAPFAGAANREFFRDTGRDASLSMMTCQAGGLIP